MKILVSGKGGAGKTTISAVLARTLARRGQEVTAIDGDSNPNLAIALGMGDLTGRMPSIRNQLGGKSEGHEIARLMDDFGVEGPDRVRLVQTGEIKRPAEGCLCCGSHMTLRDVFTRVPHGDGHVVVTDLEPGVNDVLWAWPKPGDVLVIVTDPSAKSLETGKRLAAVGRQLELTRMVVVANQVERPDDLERTQLAFPGMEVFAVPDDAELRRADRHGRSALDTAPGCAGVAAIERLAGELLAPAPG